MLGWIWNLTCQGYRIPGYHTLKATKEYSANRYGLEESIWHYWQHRQVFIIFPKGLVSNFEKPWTLCHAYTKRCFLMQRTCPCVHQRARSMLKEVTWDSVLKWELHISLWSAECYVLSLGLKKHQYDSNRMDLSYTKQLERSFSGVSLAPIWTRI